MTPGSKEVVVPLLKMFFIPDGNYFLWELIPEAINKNYLLWQAEFEAGIATTAVR